MQSDDNLDQIAHAIFSKPVQPPMSIQLQLEEATADIAAKEGVDNFVFNIVYLITYKGMKIKYGDDTTIHTLTETQFDTIKSYVASFGYKLIVEANDTALTPWEIERQGQRVYRYKVSFERLQ
jgi:hypothetical protein